MKTRFRPAFWVAVLLLAAVLAYGQQPQGAMTFTVSMEQPANHTFHVVFRCSGLKGAAQEFRMPAWSPGYYAIRDFARNVQNFRAADAKGLELKWEKSANAWKVQTGNTPVVSIAYDVTATSTFVADPYLGEDRGYIVGTGVFMYVPGQIRHPVTVEIKLDPNWKSIASGLDPVSPATPNVLKAPDFDVLYDSPILMGNLESLPPFEIKGVPHYFIGHKLGDNFNVAQFMKNLKAVVEQGIAVVGEVPYTHYTFLGIGAGAGGIEHLNSTTVPFTGSPKLDTHEGTVRQMNFLGHEYFHNFNVKRIRPIALGPFDYDKPNLTNMLWVSEGFTSYYANLMVARAGITSLEELLDSFRREIAAYENSTGHLFQSATQSSWDSWTQGPFGGRGGRGGVVKTISYYSKGDALGLLLDLKIRHETRNRKSLDSVMKTLYQKYYKELKRGWTDQEFRDVCEKTAGASLQEVFDYASTTRDIDYDKYLNYAGLQLEKPVELPEAWFGAIVEDVEGKPVITAVEGDSPAQRAFLAKNDQIKSLDGVEVDAGKFNATIAAKSPGDKIRLAVVRLGNDIEAQVELAHKLQRSCKIIRVPNPDALQAATLADLTRAR